MPCNAVVYLPATIRQLDATAIFATAATRNLTIQMLKATLAATLGKPATSVEDWGTNITAYVPNGTLRIWNHGAVSIRLNTGTRDPKTITTAIEAALAATLASLTQILAAQTIGATINVTDTQFAGNNMILTVNI
jgi:isopentenyl diphosphate isomerase/L-lactate dehydrogenase-like FMN-dependent dehydrogenase